MPCARTCLHGTSMSATVFREITTKTHIMFLEDKTTLIKPQGKASRIQSSLTGVSFKPDCTSPPHGCLVAVCRANPNKCVVEVRSEKTLSSKGSRNPLITRMWLFGVDTMVPRHSPRIPNPYKAMITYCPFKDPGSKNMPGMVGTRVL